MGNASACCISCIKMRRNSASGSITSQRDGGARPSSGAASLALGIQSRPACAHLPSESPINWSNGKLRGQLRRERRCRTRWPAHRRRCHGGTRAGPRSPIADRLRWPCWHECHTAAPTRGVLGNRWARNEFVAENAQGQLRHQLIPQRNFTCSVEPKPHQTISPPLPQNARRASCARKSPTAPPAAAERRPIPAGCLRDVRAAAPQRVARHSGGQVMTCGDHAAVCGPIEKVSDQSHAA